MEQSDSKNKPGASLFWGFVILAAASFSVAIAVLIPIAHDWTGTFVPGFEKLVSGENPYDIPTFENPPWVLLFIAPIAWLPPVLSRAVLAFVSIVSVVLVFSKLTDDFVLAVIIATSPPAVHLYIAGNIDWLILLGYISPPVLGALLVSIKPQMSIGLFVYWLYKKRFLDMIPVTLLTLLSFVLYGNWLSSRSLTLPWDTSVWPWLVVPGLIILILSVRNDDKHKAIAVSPALSPYVSFHSWLAAFVAIKRRRTAVILSAALWIVVAIASR